MPTRALVDRSGNLVLERGSRKTIRLLAVIVPAAEQPSQVTASHSPALRWVIRIPAAWIGTKHSSRRGNTTRCFYKMISALPAKSRSTWACGGTYRHRQANVSIASMRDFVGRVRTQSRMIRLTKRISQTQPIKQHGKQRESHHLPPRTVDFCLLVVVVHVLRTTTTIRSGNRASASPTLCARILSFE